MELKSNFLLTISSTCPETILETHEIFHPEKSLINQDMVILNIEYTSTSTLLDQ